MQKKYFLAFVSVFFIAALAFVFLRPMNPPSTLKISNSSMQPTLAEGTDVQLEPLSSPVKRGDIVIYDTDVSPGTLLIGRVIGVGGDHVAVRDGNAELNGKMLGSSNLQESVEGVSWKITPSPSDQISESDV